jgi:hypothetical protein
METAKVATEPDQFLRLWVAHQSLMTSTRSDVNSSERSKKLVVFILNIERPSEEFVLHLHLLSELRSKQVFVVGCPIQDSLFCFQTLLIIPAQPPLVVALER